MFLSIRSHCYIFLISCFIPSQAASVLGGLKFHGSEQSINRRTSYDVFGDRNVRFSDNFDIEFNLSLFPTTEFGYLLRIKNHESSKIYNLFYDGQGNHLTFRFNEEGKNNLIVANLDKAELPDMHWFKMKISFNLKGDSISLTIHDQVFSAPNELLPDTYSPAIFFGKSDHIIDVPTFALKDLSIGNKEKKYDFPLRESQGNIVHDMKGKAFGTVTNPEWLMNDAYHWRFKTSFRSRSVAGANYDPERKEIYYFNRDSLFIYDVRSGETKINVFEEPCPVKLILGTNFIDPSDNKLYSYEVYYAPPNDDYSGPTIAHLNLDTYQWTAENYDKLPSQLHHHGSYLNSVNKQFTLFGGFGNMHYSKNFFTYDLEKKRWDTLDNFTGDFISPRYFSSVGYLEKTNSIYIFGGMGNESGEQVVGRKYYYDLYKVDLDTKRVSKLWEIEWRHDNMVPVRGMVVLNDSSFYTLCYPEHFTQSFLKLFRFSLINGSYEILGDSIPIYSDKITTNANLYYDNGLNNLYAVVQEFEDDISSDLKVYSLAFPPITAGELAGYSTREGNNTFLVIFLSLSAASGIGYLLFKNLRSKPVYSEGVQPFSITNDQTGTTSKPNSIYLFGDFTVRDRSNRDITYMFSAQLKQIFCLILQYSTVEEGISSQRLSNILWPDKPTDKVKNSRGVTINHLRKTLSELDGIELIYEKGFFRLEQGEEFYCDYTRCLQLISSNETETHSDELIEILNRGKFLQLSDHPVFDSFKEDVEKKLEPVLLLEMEKSFSSECYLATIALSDALFNIDPLNEPALNFQMKAMQKLKMTDEARMRFQAFVIDYRKIMGNDYPHAFRG